MRNTISVIGMPSAPASQQSGPSEGLSEAIIAEVGRQKGQLSELSQKVEGLEGEIGDINTILTEIVG